MESFNTSKEFIKAQEKLRHAETCIANAKKILIAARFKRLEELWFKKKYLLKALASISSKENSLKQNLEYDCSQIGHVYTLLTYQKRIQHQGKKFNCISEKCIVCEKINTYYTSPFQKAKITDLVITKEHNLILDKFKDETSILQNEKKVIQKSLEELNSYFNEICEYFGHEISFKNCNTSTCRCCNKTFYSNDSIKTIDNFLTKKIY